VAGTSRVAWGWSLSWWVLLPWVSWSSTWSHVTGWVLAGVVASVLWCELMVLVTKLVRVVRDCTALLRAAHSQKFATSHSLDSLVTRVSNGGKIDQVTVQDLLILATLFRLTLALVIYNGHDQLMVLIKHLLYCCLIHFTSWPHRSDLLTWSTRSWAGSLLRRSWHWTSLLRGIC